MRDQDLTDQAGLIEQLTRAFAHAKMEPNALDPASLVDTRKVVGQERTLPGLV